MFGKHKENQSKETQFQSTKKWNVRAGKCFPFFILRKTLSFSLLTESSHPKAPMLC
jgi:hypothetical protein